MIVKCVVCEKTVYKRPSSISRYPHPVCSLNCSLKSPYRNFRRAEKHHNWKGDSVKYAGLHLWVRSRLPSDGKCDICKKEARLDLANKSGNYKRSLNDWHYLCRKCHMISDGRLNILTTTGHYTQPKNGKEIKCFVCSKIFYLSLSKIRNKNYCSYLCIGLSKKGLTNEQWRKSQLN